MKQLLLLSAAFFLAACACTKKAPTALPPETQEGKNTFGCFIDGKIFYPSKSSWTGGGGPLWAAYSTYTATGLRILNISAYNQDEKRNVQIGLRVDNDIVINKKYALEGSTFYSFYEENKMIELKAVEGIVEFKRFDINEKIVEEKTHRTTKVSA